MHFGAIELQAGETFHLALRSLFETAVARGTSFKTLEFLGMIVLGKSKFVRFKTDIPLDDVLADLKRGAIHRGKAGYVVKMPGLEARPVSTMLVTAVADPSLKRTYRGPAVKYWERQFIG